MEATCQQFNLGETGGVGGALGALGVWGAAVGAERFSAPMGGGWKGGGWLGLSSASLGSANGRVLTHFSVVYLVQLEGDGGLPVLSAQRRITDLSSLTASPVTFILGPLVLLFALH